MRVIGGGEKMPLSIIEPCKIEVLRNGALNMSESLHLTIGY